MHVPPRLTIDQLSTVWHLNAVPILSLIVVAGLYVIGVTSLTARGDKWPIGRTCAFLGGLFVGAYATAGWVAAYDGYLFSAHMAQHMLLTMVMPVLLALGAPITLALRTLPAAPRTLLLKLLQSRVAKIFSNPLVGFALFVATPFTFYFSGLYLYTLEHPWAHDLAHLHFVVVGCIFFWPLVGVDPLPHRPPHWARVFVLFLALPFHAFLGLAIMSGTTILGGAHYLALGISPSAALNDQHTGGGLIWGTGDVLGGFIFLAVMIQWARADEREAKRIDRDLDRREAVTQREDDELAAYNARLAALAEIGDQ